MVYSIEITPFPTPRPKLRVMNRYGKKVPQAYYPVHYQKYKDTLALLIALQKVKPGDYVKLRAVFYLPYPESTPKYKRIHGEPHLKKPDVDNYLKGLMDGLEAAGVTQNDSRFYSIRAIKLYTTGKPGIRFKLM